MGWFWGPSDSDNDNKSKDPLRDLDPSLRDFLKKESPVKYNDSNPPAPTRIIEATPKPADTTSSVPSAAEEEPKVPSQSLFPDGRYAHLWKSYESKEAVENASKSDQEKITDVLEGYKYRKAEIGRAALENCANEQWAVNDCFRNGSWGSRMTMCRDENRKLERCYMVQAVCRMCSGTLVYADLVQKFLKALGYLSTLDRTDDVDERIQMHADTLYHRMLDQEEAVEAAKAEGRPIPTFKPILTKPPSKINSGETEVPFEGNKLQPADLNPRVQKALKKRLEDLPEAERELEERAIKAEIQAGEQVAGHLETLYEKQAEERRKRKEAGRETIGDRLSTMFGR